MLYTEDVLEDDMKNTIRPEKIHKHVYLNQGIIYDRKYTKAGELRDLHISLLTTVGRRNADAEAQPCMVWVCGGAWRGGRERAAEMLPELTYLAEEGIIIAAVEYRILGEAVFPAQIEDVLTAVRYLRTNAEKYHIDPERIGIMGSSAGGHLTILAANNDGQFDTEMYNTVSSHVKCAIDMYGIADIEAVYRFNINALKNGQRTRTRDPWHFPESELLGDLPVNVLAAAKRAGGINGINDRTCPVLILHGNDDHVVNIEQSEMYYQALKDNGRDVTYYVLDGADHGSDEFFQTDVQKIILDYLKDKLL